MKKIKLFCLVLCVMLTGCQYIDDVEDTISEMSDNSAENDIVSVNNENSDLENTDSANVDTTKINNSIPSMSQIHRNLCAEAYLQGDELYYYEDGVIYIQNVITKERTVLLELGLYQISKSLCTDYRGSSYCIENDKILIIDKNGNTKGQYAFSEDVDIENIVVSDCVCKSAYNLVVLDNALYYIEEDRLFYETYTQICNRRWESRIIKYDLSTKEVMEIPLEKNPHYFFCVNNMLYISVVPFWENDVEKFAWVKYDTLDMSLDEICSGTYEECQNNNDVILKSFFEFDVCKTDDDSKYNQSHFHTEDFCCTISKVSLSGYERQVAIPLVLTEDEFGSYCELFDDEERNLAYQYYKKYDINNLSKKDMERKDELLARYPILLEQVVYILRDTARINVKTSLSESFKKVGCPDNMIVYYASRDLQAADNQEKQEATIECYDKATGEQYSHKEYPLFVTKVYGVIENCAIVKIFEDTSYYFALIPLEQLIDCQKEIEPQIIVETKPSDSAEFLVFGKTLIYKTGDRNDWQIYCLD